MFNVVSNGRDLMVNFSYPNTGQTYCEVIDNDIEALDEDKNATILMVFRNAIQTTNSRKTKVVNMPCGTL